MDAVIWTLVKLALVPLVWVAWGQLVLIGVGYWYRRLIGVGWFELSDAVDTRVANGRTFALLKVGMVAAFQRGSVAVLHVAGVLLWPLYLVQLRAVAREQLEVRR